MLLSQPQSMSTAQLDGFTVAPEASSAPEYIGPGSDSFNQYYNPQDGVVPTNAGIPTAFLSTLMAPSIQVVGSAAQRALMQKLGLAMPTKSNLASGIGAARSTRPGVTCAPPPSWRGSAAWLAVNAARGPTQRTWPASTTRAASCSAGAPSPSASGARWRFIQTPSALGREAAGARGLMSSSQSADGS